MTKTEFTTIADALKTKQSWIRKSFDELLSAWCEATKDMEVIGNVYIGDFDINDEYTHSAYLVPYEYKLYYLEEGQYGVGLLDYYTKDGTSECNYRDKLTIDLIRWAAPKISHAITKHFKRIQADIDVLSEVGQEIRRITACLEK